MPSSATPTTQIYTLSLRRSSDLPWKPALSKTNELAYMILQNLAIITAREREQRIMSAPSLTCLFSPLVCRLHDMSTRGQQGLDIGRSEERRVGKEFRYRSTASHG